MVAVASSETFTGLYGGTFERTVSIPNSNDNINFAFCPQDFRSVIEQFCTNSQTG
jgi:hypothetical protein